MADGSSRRGFLGGLFVLFAWPWARRPAPPPAPAAAGTAYWYGTTSSCKWPSGPNVTTYTYDASGGAPAVTDRGVMSYSTYLGGPGKPCSRPTTGEKAQDAPGGDKAAPDGPAPADDLLPPADGSPHARPRRGGPDCCGA